MMIKSSIPEPLLGVMMGEPQIPVSIWHVNTMAHLQLGKLHLKNLVGAKKWQNTHQEDWSCLPCNTWSKLVNINLLSLGKVWRNNRNSISITQELHKKGFFLKLETMWWQQDWKGEHHLIGSCRDGSSSDFPQKEKGMGKIWKSQEVIYLCVKVKSFKFLVGLSKNLCNMCGCWRKVVLGSNVRS